jgi:hypothetical protein
MPQATIKKMFPDLRFGFLSSDDGSLLSRFHRARRRLRGISCRRSNMQREPGPKAKSCATLVKPVGHMREKRKASASRTPQSFFVIASKAVRQIRQAF